MAALLRGRIVAMAMFVFARVAVFARMVARVAVIMVALVAVIMVVQMVTVHIHAPVEITIRLMDHRAGNILLGVAEQDGEEVASSERLRHPSRGNPHKRPYENYQDYHHTVWKKFFHPKFLG